MSFAARPVDVSDLETVVDLLVADAEQRQATDPRLWKVDPAARDNIRRIVTAFLEKGNPPFHQRLLLAELDRRCIGIAHTMVLPVPPIYAGEGGPPGLVLEDCHVTDDAPAAARQALLDAAEADLLQAGANILLGSSAVGRVWEEEYQTRGYAPLTLYFCKVGLRPPKSLETVRSAEDRDIADIVMASAENRRILFDLNAFWKPSCDADGQFDTWMRKSLTLTDRDMFVAESDGEFRGYAIAQPATHLHFPLPHDISDIGVIDDYYHVDLLDPLTLPDDASGASDLLYAAEAALAARGKSAAMVVCPAAWASKIELLEAAGYSNAITWFKKGQRRR